MSRLEELIQKLCPDGVEFRKIKNVYKRIKGTSITAAKMKEISDPTGEIKIFAGGKTAISAKETDIPQANITRVPTVLVQSRGMIDAIYYDKPFTFKNEMWAYTAEDTISVKYLYYVLKNNIQHFREAASGMGSLPQISLPVTEDFIMPIPPLPVQSEIVRILDNFAELTSKLTAELTARKKQYEYYRSILLSFDGGKVEWKPFGECCILSRGDYITKKTAQKGKIPVILGGQEPAYYIDKSNHIGKAIVISRSGASAGFVSYWNEPIFVTDGFVVEPKEELNFKFLFFYLKNLQPDLNAMKKGGGVPHITGENIVKLNIPVPPLPEQEHIVAILDRFDTLCNNISTGLPAEIEARKKQYEYYRDKLFAFKEVTDV